MKFRPSISKVSRQNNFLRVNPSTAIELIDSNLNHIFRFRFGIYVSSFSNDLKDFNSVKIEVKKKENVNEGNTHLQKMTSFIKASTSNFLPSSVQNKLFSGIKLVASSNELLQNRPLGQTFVNVAERIKIAQTKQCNIADLEIVPPKTWQSVPSPIDSKNLIRRINDEKLDPSSITQHDSLQNTTINDLSSNDGKMASFHHDLLKFYLSAIPASNRESELINYQKFNTIKSLDIVDFYGDIEIPNDPFQDALIVNFFLMTSKNEVKETASLEFSFKTHLDAFRKLSIPPSVSYEIHNNAAQISITNHEAKIKSSGVNIYLKSIEKTGDVGNYKLIKTIKSTNKNLDIFTLELEKPLSILRVVPIGKDGNESYIFTNVVLGDGYNSLGSLTITPIIDTDNEIKIFVYNVPNNSKNIKIYRRDCTAGIDSVANLILVKNDLNGLESFQVIDKNDLNSDHVYEYYSVVDDYLFSNFVIIKNKSIEKGIFSDTPTVSLESVDTFTDYWGNPNLSFKIITTINSTKNQTITDALKSQFEEVYKQFLDPLANSKNPLGNNTDGIFDYADLFIHEVERINLNTSEREVFSLVADGNFIDNSKSQSISNIKPINPKFSYIYLVSTFRKNPIELFKNYIAKGVTDSGKEWFYLPYKWKNSEALKGTLAAEDKDGIPIISKYEDLTSNFYGLTTSYTLDGLTNFIELANITARRIDINTVKITWEYSGSVTKRQEIYDCFIVMKVSNGNRKIIGATKNSFIYHDLNEEDAGTIYYIIVPITSEFDIDKPGYTDSLFIDPNDLFEKEFTDINRIHQIA